MKLIIKAHPKSKQSKIISLGPNTFEIWVRQAPENGKANQAVIEALSEFLKKPKSSFTIKSGLSSKNKIIECA